MDKFTRQIQGDGLTLVDFYAAWCRPCKMMHPILDELRRSADDRVTILRLDIDHPDNKPLVQLYNIVSIPTLILFRGGHQLWRTSGVVSAYRLMKLIDRFEEAPTPVSEYGH